MSHPYLGAEAKAEKPVKKVLPAALKEIPKKEEKKDEQPSK